MACRMSYRWKSKFARFVMAYGVARMATQLEIHPSAVYHWIRGAHVPRHTHAAIIQRLARESGVTLRLEQIYQHSSDLAAVERGSGTTSFSENRLRKNGFAPAPAK